MPPPDDDSEKKVERGAWRVTALRIGRLLGLVASLLVLIAFVTPNWLERSHSMHSSATSGGTYGKRRFDKLGLWFFCFDGFGDPNHRYPQLFYGCRWLFDEDFWFLRDFLMPGFFIVVQVTYTCALLLAFIGTLGLCAAGCECSGVDVLDASALGGAVQPRILIFVAVDYLLCAILSSIAVCVFAVRGDGRDWMPDWRNNYVAFSFILACVAAFLHYMAALLLYVDAAKRLKRIKRERQAFEMTARGGHGGAAHRPIETIIA